MLDRLRSDHARLKEVSTELLALVETDAPCDPATLADCRWRLARLLLQHLPVEDRHVYRPLEQDVRPEVALTAKRFRLELEASYARFQDHADRWTGDAIVSDWPGYRSTVRQLVQSLHARIEREEATLYPLVGDAARVATHQPTDRNWAADGWSLREKIVSAAGGGKT